MEEIGKTERIIIKKTIQKIPREQLADIYVSLIFCDFEKKKLFFKCANIDCSCRKVGITHKADINPLIELLIKDNMRKKRLIKFVNL